MESRSVATVIGLLSHVGQGIDQPVRKRGPRGCGQWEWRRLPMGALAAAILLRLHYGLQHVRFGSTPAIDRDSPNPRSSYLTYPCSSPPPGVVHPTTRKNGGRILTTGKINLIPILIIAGHRSFSTPTVASPLCAASRLGTHLCMVRRFCAIAEASRHRYTKPTSAFSPDTPSKISHRIPTSRQGP